MLQHNIERILRVRHEMRMDKKEWYTPDYSLRIHLLLFVGFMAQSRRDQGAKLCLKHTLLSPQQGNEAGLCLTLPHTCPLSLRAIEALAARNLASAVVSTANATHQERSSNHLALALELKAERSQETNECFSAEARWVERGQLERARQNTRVVQHEEGEEGEGTRSTYTHQQEPDS